jgi:hypothetical protein
MAVVDGTLGTAERFFSSRLGQGDPIRGEREASPMTLFQDVELYMSDSLAAANRSLAN